MRKLNPYSIGETPTFNPCEKCIVKVNCSEQCDDRLRYLLKELETTPPTYRIKLNKRKKKK